MAKCHSIDKTDRTFTVQHIKTFCLVSGVTVVITMLLILMTIAKWIYWVLVFELIVQCSFQPHRKVVEKEKDGQTSVGLHCMSSLFSSKIHMEMNKL